MSPQTKGIPGRVEYREGDTLSQSERSQLLELLSTCFPGPQDAMFKTQTYWREMPQHRMLYFDETGALAGHLAGHSKFLRGDEQDFRVLGISEVAVLPSYRGRGISRWLLDQMESWARGAGYAFCALFGNPKIYAGQGYSLAGNHFRYQDWETKEERYGLLPSAQYKCLGSLQWPQDELNLLGPTW